MVSYILIGVGSLSVLTGVSLSFKAADHVSSIYDAEMPWSVFFNGGVAFHEGSLTVLSHGCIHLSSAAAEAYFAATATGLTVSARRDWNGKLRATSSTSLWNP